MSGPRAPFVEVGLYFGAVGGHQLATVLSELVSVGGRVEGSLSHSRKDSRKSFQGPTDFLREPSGVLSPDAIDSAENRVVSVTVGGLLEHRPAERSELTFGRIRGGVDDEDHPVTLWLSGDEMSGAVNGGRSSRDYPRIVNLFDTLVEQLDPWYAGLGIEEAIDTPSGYKADEYSRLGRVYVSHRLVGVRLDGFADAIHTSVRGGHVLADPGFESGSGGAALEHFGRFIASRDWSALGYQRP